MEHTGHNHSHTPESTSRTFVFCVVLNLLFVAFEVFMGFAYNSVGLLSDAVHNLGDVFSLLLVLLAFRMAGYPSNNHFTYGYKKSTILISLVNAVILLVSVGIIVLESIHRLREPSTVSGEAIGWTAGCGIVINGLTTWLLMKGRKEDLNIQGAFLHMLADTLVSVGVVVSGVIISLNNWTWIDPAISIVIAVIILVSTFKLLKESLYMSLDAIPSSIDMEEVKNAIDETVGAGNWHHLHIWAISTRENAATIHVVLDDVQQMEKMKKELKECLASKGVSHVTIEFETQQNGCRDVSC